MDRNSKKNGHTKNGKQTKKCKSCNTYFVSVLDRWPVKDKVEMLKKLLLERISLAGICRVLNICEKTLRKYMNIIFSEVPDHLNIDLAYYQMYKTKKNKIMITRGRVEIDEMWTFVGKKRNAVWVWIAYNPDTDEVLAFHCGDRDGESAKILWDKIPEKIKENSLFFTDQLAAYNLIPSHQHIKVKGGNRVTNHVERINCTLRQRNPRLARKSLSFSKKLDNLLSSLKYFFTCYNSGLIT